MDRGGRRARWACALVTVACASAAAARAADWVVTGQEVVEDQAVALDGDLVVEAGGKLTLRRSTVTLSCGSHGQYGVEVRSGGVLVVEQGSLLTTSDNGARMLVRVASGGRLEVLDSQMRRFGWVNGGLGAGIGMVVDGELRLERSTFAEYDIVHLRGPGAGDVIVGNAFACDGHSEGHLFVDERPGVIITDNTFGPNEWFGVSFWEADSCVVSRNVFDHTAHGPVVFRGCWNSEFSFNRAVGCSGPYVLRQSGNTTIADNTFEELGGGLTVMFSDNAAVVRNTFSGASSNDILLSYSAGSVVADNVIGSRVEIGDLASVHLYHVSDTVVTNNTIDALVGDQRAVIGILLWGSSSGNEIRDNRIAAGRRGISVHYGSNGNRIVYNTVTSAVEEPLIVEDSSDNEIHHNSLLAFGRGPFDDTGTNRWDDGAEGNYWFDHGGTSPYVVGPAARDEHPLLAPTSRTAPVAPAKPPLPRVLERREHLDVESDLEIADQTVGPLRWLHVYPGARLTLRRVTLLMVGDENGIFVRGGGATLEVYDSRIVPPAVEEGGYFFQVWPGSTLIMKDSEVSGVGAWAGCGDWAAISTESATVEMERNVIRDGMCGVYLGSGARLEGNELFRLGNGLSCGYISGTEMKGNRVHHILDWGVNAWGTGNVLAGNTVWRIWGPGIVSGENALVTGNTVTDSGVGLRII